tara:strand:- start:829 stop:2772 length:1944 start_codon:yes stop_codon:yes gene_type:complete
MATSLLGKADATIAGMSLKEAMADVTPNLKGVYDEKVKTQALLQTEVESYFDGLNKQNNALSDTLDETLNTTVEGADTEETQEMYNNYINVLRDELENVPKGRDGDLQRAKIKAKINRLKDNAGTTNQTLIDLKTQVLDKDYNTDGTGGPTLAFLNQIANGSVKRSISSDGRIVFTNPATGEEVDEKGLKALIATKDPSLNAGFNKVTTSANAVGKTGTNFDKKRQSYINDYYDSFTTKTGFADNIHRRQEGLEFTFAEYLSGKGDGTENMKIFDALRKIMPDQIPQDKNSDGKITADDFASPENAIKLIKSLTQINNPAEEGGFNFQLAKQVAAEFYTDNVAKKEHEDGMAIFNKASNKGKGSDEEESTDLLPSVPDGKSIKLGFYASGAMVPVRKSDAVSVMENIQAGLPFGVGEPRKFYSYVNGNWYENFKEGDNEESESFVGSVKNLVANALGTSNNKDFMNLTTTVAPASTVSTNLTVDNNGVVIEQPADVKAQENIFKQLSIASNDDDAADGLNKALGLTDRRTDGKQPYMFMPWFAAAPFMPNQKIAKGEMGTGILSSDAAESDDLMLYNARTGEVIMDSATGERRRFKSGDAIADFNSQTGSAEAKEIIDLLTELGIYSDSGANSGVGSKYPVKKDKSE